jgi:lipoate-protein ligase A
MWHCDLTFPTAEENLACDEALLEMCEAGTTGDVIRFWEPNQYFVVVGYANQVAREVNHALCRQNTIPVLRRCSGGGTGLQGPGCLHYSLILATDQAGAPHHTHYQRLYPPSPSNHAGIELLGPRGTQGYGSSDQRMILR